MGLSTILAFAPTAVRAIGSLFGDSSKEKRIADRVANVAEAVQGKSQEEKDAALSQELSGMSPEDREAFYKVEAKLKALEEETKQASIEADARKFEAEQQTHRAALNQSDVFTKQTRPKIARQSWKVAAAYGLLVGVVIPSFAAVFPETVTVSFSETIFLALAAPAMTYMGVRGFEKIRAGKA